MLDNGGVFAGHASISQSLGGKIYFAMPDYSWKRGFNANTNGLLRRLFPKGMKIDDVSKNKIDEAQFLINIRPRKALNYFSPIEFLSGKCVGYCGNLGIKCLDY